MQRLVTRSLMLVASLVIIGSVMHLDLAAQESTPAASPESTGLSAPPAVGAVVASSSGACDSADFPAGQNGITYQPIDDFGFVVPVEFPDHVLYLTEDTLPPDTCFLFERGTHGASTFLVQQGTVEFIAWSGPPLGEPVIWAGNEAGNYVSIDLGAPVTLDAGDWVTIDQAVQEYAYRNPGAEDGRIVMAAYELAVGHNGCHSGCRRHP